MCLIYNLHSAVHAIWAIVFAQLIVEGKAEGVHAVVVRIRNDDMTPCKGVRVEDMGYKMGVCLITNIDNQTVQWCG